MNKQEKLIETYYKIQKMLPKTHIIILTLKSDEQEKQDIQIYRGKTNYHWHIFFDGKTFYSELPSIQFWNNSESYSPNEQDMKLCGKLIKKFKFKSVEEFKKYNELRPVSKKFDGFRRDERKKNKFIPHDVELKFTIKKNWFEHLESHCGMELFFYGEKK